MENKINLNIEGNVELSKLEKGFLSRLEEDLIFLKEVPLFLQTSSKEEVELDAFLYKGDTKQAIHLYPKGNSIKGFKISTEIPNNCEITGYSKSLHIVRSNKNNSDIKETYYCIFYEPNKE